MDKRKSLGILAIAAAAMLLFTAVSAGGSALAAKGGGKGHGGSGTPASGTLTVSPNPVPVGSACITIGGSGFAANQDLTINAWFMPQPSVNTGTTGSFSFVYCPSGGFWLAGPSSVQALSSTLAVLATTNYTVQ
jgi:hypothetical protein